MTDFPTSSIVPTPAEAQELTRTIDLVVIQVGENPKRVTIGVGTTWREVSEELRINNGTHTASIGPTFLQPDYVFNDPAIVTVAARAKNG